MSAFGSFFGLQSLPDDCKTVEFWKNPERAGWLMKQGEYIKTWRRRWFVLKDGRLFWFMEAKVTPSSQPRGVINVGKCLTIKGAEDILNRPHAFELSTANDTMFFIADSDKEKEDWINAVGRAIVRHSRSVTEYEVLDYNYGPTQGTPSRGPTSASKPVTSGRSQPQQTKAQAQAPVDDQKQDA